VGFLEKPVRFLIFSILSVSLILEGAYSFAQEKTIGKNNEPGQEKSAQAEKGEKEIVRLSSFREEVRLRDKIIIFIGNVEIEYKGVTILAENVVAFLGEKGKIAKVYAEGAVLVRRGEDKISANAFYYDFQTESGKIVDGYVITTREALQRFSPEEEKFFFGAEKPKAGEVELFVRAKVISVEKPKKYLAEDVTISTCSFVEPHWGLKSSRAIVHPGGEVEARGNTLYIGWLLIPLFPIHFERDWRMPLHRLTFGSSTRLGSSTLLESHLLSGKSYDTLLATDLYSKRGTGVGLTTTYKDKQESLFYGFLKGYYIHDKGEDTEGVPLEVADRYRINFLHSHQSSPGTHIDAEFSKVSDSGFLSQYFEREVKEGRPKETYLYLRSTERNLGVRFFSRFRTEDFLTETEYLPEIRADVISQPLLGGFYLGTSFETAALRKKYDSALAIPDEEARRVDLTGTLSRPFAADRYAAFNPFFTTRLSKFSRNSYDDNTVDRTALTAGLSVSSQISRNFPTKSAFLNLDSLIHVLSPSISYSNTFKNTLPPEDLYQFDEIDSVKEEEKITLLLSNKLLTRESVKKGKVTSEFLSLDLEISHFPHSKRDNNGYSFSNLDAELRLRVSPAFLLACELQYNFEEGKAQSGSFSLSYQHFEYLNLSLTGRYAAGEDSLVVVAASVKLSEKWQAGTKYQYNIDIGNYSLQTYTLTRTLHCWIIEGGFQMERETGEKKFVFYLSPLSMFEAKKLKSSETATYFR
jgi:lipopolysaccharide assembly outer membrane protein LptD (OstA)